MKSWTSKILQAGAASKQAMKLRLDSWANMFTNLGTTSDKTTQTLPFADVLLSPLQLEILYHTDDIAARIVAAVPDECFREPFSVINKAGGDEETDAPRIHEQAAELEQALIDLGARAKFREAHTWGRLYGLGAILIGANDGLPPSEPLDWQRVTSVDYLTVLDKRDLVPWRWYADPTAAKFGDVALYQVQPVGVFVGAPYDLTSTNQIILVHESRLIRFGGELTSKRERLRNQGADYSILQKCFRALQMTNNNWQSVSALLADASQGVFKIQGLIDMISQEPNVMQQRMQLVDQMRSVLRAIILDAEGEDFTRVATPFTGLPEMLEQTWKRLASAARMPLTILMGVSAAGLNATGDSDIRWWYDSIKETQRETIQPNLERLIKLISISKGFGNEQNWSVKFAPLWQPKPAEKALIQLQVAQRDQIYLQEGVLLPEEVALSRFGDGVWEEETTIDVDTRKTVLELELANKEEEAKNPPEPQVIVAPRSTPGSYRAGAPSKNGSNPKTPDPRPPGVSDD